MLAGMPGASVFAETTTTTELLSDIPVGPADNNTQTSDALSLILENCAKAYADADAMYAIGTFVQASKSDEKTTYLSAKITINYLGPDKLSVVSKSEADHLDGAFYADGTTVTHISTANKEFAKLPQPPLDAYAASWRAGEIFTEFSGVLGMSGTGSLLVASNPLQWIHEGVVRYVYEGSEENAGRPCYRVRFNQENPDSIVIIWIDKETWFVSKVSFITSYNEDYELMETFEEGSLASMRVVTWDSITTDPKTVKPNAFKAAISDGFKPVKQEKEWWDYDVSPGFWESMVKQAAKSSPEETTWSLNRQLGNIDLTLEQFVETKEPVEDLDSPTRSAGQESPMALAFKDGTVNIYRHDGTLSTTLRLQNSLSMLGWLETSTSAPLLIVTDKDGKAMNGYALDGKHQWTYEHPYTKIETFRSPEGAVFLSLGEKGMRRINPDGSVVFANSKIQYAEAPDIADEGKGNLVIETSGRVIVADRQLHVVDSFDSDENFGAIRWDDSNKDAPLVALVFTSDRDVLLQRRDLSGEVVKTTMIEPKAKEFPLATFLWAKLRVGDVVEKCAVVLLANGKIVITNISGDVIYRGQVTANPALVAQNDDNIINFAAVSDVNGDGAEEIYFPIHKHMLRLKTEP